MGADWLDALEDVGGRLLPAARAFLLSQPPPLPSAGGAAGVRWLAAQLEEFVDRDTNGTEDDRFVEEAGAFFGLLLVGHLGGRTREQNGRHRVQLGRFGWFDPFGAIQEILDAEDPRACLSEYLKSAEREAGDRGPVSRVVRVFADELGRVRPDLEIESQFELEVDLSNGATVDLNRLERIAKDGDAAAAHEAARRIISMLPGAQGQATTPWSEAAPRLLPRLVSEAFVDALPPEQRLFLEPIGHDVFLALQLRYGNRARYIRLSEVGDWADDPSVVRRRALDNLAKASDDLRIEPVKNDIVRIRNGDGLDGARLLLPKLTKRLERLHPGAWIASVPHRDVLLLAPDTAVEHLARCAEDAAMRAPHPVSPSLFRLEPDWPIALVAQTESD